MKSIRPVRAARRQGRFEELRLKNDRIDLTLLPEFGCHWTRLRLSVKGSWVDFLLPVPDHQVLREKSTGYGSYIMAPWSNRLAGATFAFEGRTYTLRSNFPDGTAIHGDVRTRPWKVLASGPAGIEASLDSRDFEDFNYPFTLRFRHTLELAGDGLRVALAIDNLDSRRAPVGFGFHPFVLRRLSPVDRDLMLVVPAEKHYPADRCLPTGPPVDVAGATDLRSLRRLGTPGLDHCFTSLTESHFRMVYPETRAEVRFRVDPVFTHAVIYAPNDDQGRARDFVGVEPVTNANNGFNLLSRGWTGTGVKVLEPGESWGGEWELTVGDL